MKNTILLLTILVALSGCAHRQSSQDSLTFKVQYKPGMQYNSVMLQTSETGITYTGPDEFLAKLQKKGVNNPTFKHSKIETRTVSRTGNPGADNSFPLILTFVSTTGNARQSLPPGSTVYGHCSAGSTPVLDSLAADGMSQEYKKAILGAVQSSLSPLVSLPETTLKTGEEFSHQTPLSIPLSDSATLDMSLTTHYTLRSINKGIARFDISQVYTMPSLTGQQAVKATGKGQGELLYDIANSFYIKYQIVSEMNLYINFGGYNVSSISNNSFIQTTVISPN